MPSQQINVALSNDLLEQVDRLVDPMLTLYQSRRYAIRTLIDEGLRHHFDAEGKIVRPAIERVDQGAD